MQDTQKVARRDALGLRIISAAVGLPLVLAAIWFGGPLLFFFGLLISILGLIEFRVITAPFGALSLTVAGAATLALFAAAWQGTPFAPPVIVAVVIGGLLWHMGRQLLHLRSESGLSGWALTVLASLYPGALLAFGLAIHELEYSYLAGTGSPDGGAFNATVSDWGRNWLLFFVLMTFASDTGAYFVGRTIGRHKMAPRISPGKTWEGAIGGLVVTALLAYPLIVLLRIPMNAVVCDPLVELPFCTVGLGILDIPSSLAVPLAIGAAVSLLAQAGDLGESFLKRASGVKDAGRLVPGHGGILDRLDSIVVVLPAAYYGLTWLT